MKNKVIEETENHSLQKTKEGKKLFTPKKLIAMGAFIIFILLLLFFIILPTMQGSMHFLIVLSGSMNPEINPGDIVVSTYTNPEEIQINDIITFAFADNPKKCITHRVINITNEGFQTKGDANEDPDQRIAQSSEVIGKVVLVIPYLGYLPHFAKSPLGFITLIIIPGVLIIVGEIWNIARVKKKEPGEKKQQAKKKPKQPKKKTSEKLKKTIRCPKCQTKITCEGTLGQKIHVTCPNCGNKGIVSFEETNLIK